MASLADIREGWDHAAKTDPLFNILTQPGCEDNQWDPDDFFARGRDEVDTVLSRLDGLGFGFVRNRALDFGCGVGRLTQALAAHFRWVVGVDASGEMVKLAKQFAAERGCNKVGFRTNCQPNLNCFHGGTRDGFDFIYSVITLQHMPHELQQAYVGEFVRVLKKDGLAVFQIPEGSRYDHPNGWLSMYGTPRPMVERWVADAGGSVVDAEVSEHSGSGWKGWRYAVTRG